MNSKKKVALLRTAIKELIEEEEKIGSSSSSVDNFVEVVKDTGDAIDDRRIISKLLSQVINLAVYFLDY